MHIHIIGIGAMGSLFAFHLRRALPAAKITLHLRATTDNTGGQTLISGSTFATRFRTDFDSNSSIQIERQGFRQRVSGFDYEISNPPGQNAIEDIVFNDDGTPRRSFAWSTLEGKISDVSLRKFSFPKSFVAKNHAPNNEPISCLIVLPKAPFVHAALKSVQHRLNSRSTIALFQNGMGLYEELLETMFRNPLERPNFVIGSSSHGAWVRGVRDVVHVSSNGSVMFSPVPDWKNRGGRDYEKSYWESDLPENERSLSLDDILPQHLMTSGQLEQQSRYQSLREMLTALLAMKELNPRWVPSSELQIFLRRKLVANAIINPITALLGCRNGDLFVESATYILARNVAEEAEAVFRAELRGVAQQDGATPDISTPLPHLLEADSLLQNAVRIARDTAGNLSSMLIDVRAGRTTEARYINGFLRQLGNDLGVPTPTNTTLETLVGLKKKMPQVGASELINFRKSK